MYLIVVDDLARFINTAALHWADIFTVIKLSPELKVHNILKTLTFLPFGSIVGQFLNITGFNQFVVLFCTLHYKQLLFFNHHPASNRRQSNLIELNRTFDCSNIF